LRLAGEAGELAAECQALVKACFAVRVEDRPSFDEVVARLDAMAG
jgi:hypothetical protein